MYRQETPRAIPAHGKAKMLDCRDLLSEPVPCDAGSGRDRRLYVPGSRQKQPGLLPALGHWEVQKLSTQECPEGRLRAELATASGFTALRAP